MNLSLVNSRAADAWMEIYKSACMESFNLLDLSLRSKRFRVVLEQRMTKERQGTGFSVLAARKIEREPKRFFFLQWLLLLFYLFGCLRQRLRLTPGHGAWVRYSMRTNVNTPFFQVPTPEFGRDLVLAHCPFLHTVLKIASDRAKECNYVDWVSYRVARVAGGNDQASVVVFWRRCYVKIGNAARVAWQLRPGHNNPASYAGYV